MNRANTYRFSQPALLDEAQLDCELALKLQPDGKRAEAVLAKIKETREESDPKALLKRAIAVLEHEKDAPGNLLGVDAATKALDKAIELSPGNAQIWYWRGVAENTDAFGGRIGSKESALPFFDKAIDRNPKYSVAYLQRALVRLHLVGLKESDKALVASVFR